MRERESERERGGGVGRGRRESEMINVDLKIRCRLGVTGKVFFNSFKSFLSLTYIYIYILARFTSST